MSRRIPSEELKPIGELRRQAESLTTHRWSKYFTKGYKFTLPVLWIFYSEEIS